MSTNDMTIIKPLKETWAWAVLVPSLVLASLSSSACTKRGPKDIGNQNTRSEFTDGSSSGSGSGASSRDAGTTPTDHIVANPTVNGRKPRELAKASARAIVTNATHVYFGNAEDDTIYRFAKAGSEPTRITRRAPMPNALAIDTSGDQAMLVWIGSPGDVVLRAPVKGGAPTTLRDGAIFANIAVASNNGDVFFTEIHGASGALTRVTGATASRLATFDGSPRGIAIDDQNVFIATTTHLLATPRNRGDVIELGAGAGFASPQVDGTWVYATVADPKGGRGRVIVRARKAGRSANGPVPGAAAALETIVTNVRDAPIALHEGSLYWFDAERPALLAADTSSVVSGGSNKTPTRTISEDPILDHVYGIAIDDDGAFIASGYGEGGRILSVLLR